MTDLVPYSDIERMGTAIAKSGLFGFKTAEQAIAIMLVAQATGQHPALAVQDYDLIQGKPAKKPQAMLRDFLAGGGRVEWHASDREQAEATFSHAQGGSIKIRWDMKRAGLMGFAGKDNWKKQPDVMLRWRCVSEGIRIIYPGATSGMYVPDEVRDFTPPEKDVTPRPAPVAVAVTADGAVIDAKTGEVMQDPHGNETTDPDADAKREYLDAIAKAADMDALKTFYQGALKLSKDKAWKEQVVMAKDKRKGELTSSTKEFLDGYGTEQDVPQ